MSAPAVEPVQRQAPVGHACLTGWATHLPASGEAHTSAVDEARELLGRRGLLYKEHATLLALCAVHRALGLQARAPRAPTTALDPRTAVVASSNLGNVETVTKVARTVRTGSARDVSLLDAPNASSNVVASSVAIWFRLGGPNLMVCSGATAGLDAVWLALLLLRTGRADRVVTVGVEPADEVATALRGQRRGVRAPACAGAASIVLERADIEAGAMLALGPIQFAPVRELLDLGGRDALLVGPSNLARPGQPVIDLENEMGDLYGALGVMQLASAAAILAESPGSAPADKATIVCGDDFDGWRTAAVHRQQNLGVRP